MGAPAPVTLDFFRCLGVWDQLASFDDRDQIPARGTYAKTDARRRAILGAAVEVFVKGLRSGSLRDVAKRTRISQTGLLHHLPSKEALVNAVLVRRARQHAPPVRRGSDGARRAAFGRRRGRAQPADAGALQLHTSLAAEAIAPDHPAHEHFLRRHAWTVDHFRAAFEVLAADGPLRSDVDPSGAARGLCAVLDGLQVQWLYARDTDDMAAGVRAHLQSLLTVPL